MPDGVRCFYFKEGVLPNIVRNSISSAIGVLDTSKLIP